MAQTSVNDDSNAADDPNPGETQLAHEGGDSQDSKDQTTAPAALALDEFMTPLPVPLPTTTDADADADEDEENEQEQGNAEEKCVSIADKATDETKEGGGDKNTKASSGEESKILSQDMSNMVVEINEDDDIIIGKPSTTSSSSSTKKQKPSPKSTTLKSPTTPGATYRRGEYNSKTKRMSETDLSFEKTLNKQACHCNNQKQCKLLLKQYYQDQTSPYPSGKDHPQLIISIANPRNPNGRNKKQAKRKQQIYDRAAQLLNVSNAEKRDCIKAGIHHFPRVVIESYANNPLRKEKGKLPKFIDYLLPKELVEMKDYEDRPLLGRELTDEDMFNCIETCVESKVCRKENEANGEGKCQCNLYMNLPFVTCDMAKESMGQKIVLVQAPKVREKYNFEEKIDGKKHKQCRTCKVLKKRDEYGENQWRKPAGMSECRACGMKEVQAVSTSTREQIRVLSHDNAKWKQDHKHLQMAHNQAQSKIKQLTLQLDVARKKVKSLQGKTSRAKTSLDRTTGELKFAREQQAYYQSLPIPTVMKAKAASMKATKAASKKAAADKTRGTKKERYGERYELISNPKKRKNPDGSFLPIQPPKRLDDGSYKKPCGRAPKGYRWDGTTGLWMPQEEGEGLVSDRMRLQPAHPPTQAEDGTFKRPYGRQPQGHRWDGVSGMWVPEEEEEQQHNNMDEGDSSDEEEEEEEEEEEDADDEQMYHYGVHHAGMEQAEVEVEARTRYSGHGGYNDC